MSDDLPIELTDIHLSLCEFSHTVVNTDLTVALDLIDLFGFLGYL